MNTDLLTKRRLAMGEHINNLVELEKLYFLISSDIGLLTEGMVAQLRQVNTVKKTIKEEAETVSSFNREVEMSEEYLVLKSYSLSIEALSKMMAGIRMRVDSLRAEVKGQY